MAAGPVSYTHLDVYKRQSYADRGKVDIFITYENLSQSQVSVKYNAALAAEYLKYLNQMAEEDVYKRQE